MQYTVDYFLDKFQRIPEGKWTSDDLTNQAGQKCALGHCGGWVADSLESKALGKILLQYYDLKGIQPETRDNQPLLNEAVWNINDGNIPFKGLGKTPKQRILAALRDIKKMQEPKYPDITKSLAVLPEDKKETDVINDKILQS